MDFMAKQRIDELSKEIGNYKFCNSTDLERYISKAPTYELLDGIENICAKLSLLNPEFDRKCEAKAEYYKTEIESYKNEILLRCKKGH